MEKKVLLLELITDVPFYKLRHKSQCRQFNTEQRHFKGDKLVLYKMRFCCKIEKNRLIRSDLVSKLFSRPN